MVPTSEQNKTNNLEIEKNAKSLLSKCTQLVEHISEVALPTLNKEPFMALPDKNKWSKWRYALHRNSNPIHLFYQSDEALFKRDIYIFSFWILIYSSWIRWLKDGMIFVFQFNSISSADVAIPWWGYIELTILLLGLLLWFVPYYHGAYFILNKNNKITSKLLWVICLVIFILYIFFAIKTDFSDTYQIALSDPTKSTFFYLIIILFLVPFSIASVSVIFIGLKMSLLMMKYILDGFIKSHSPYTLKRIQELIESTIISESGPWKIYDLSEGELIAIREWSRDNLESTEKRVMPTFWVLALAGLFVNTKFFENWVSDWGNYFSSQYAVFSARDSLYTISAESALIFIILLPLGLAILLFLFASYFAIFRNIAIQSLLIEICTILIYSKNKSQTEHNKIMKKSKSFLFWELLKSFWR